MIQENLRNIAIIAHVDHGKTTLVDQMLKQYPAFEMKEGMDRFLYNGNSLFPNQFTGTSAEKKVSGWVRIYDSQGHFCGVYQYDMQKKCYRPVKMFLDWRNDR